MNADITLHDNSDDNRSLCMCGFNASAGIRRIVASLRGVPGPERAGPGLAGGNGTRTEAIGEERVSQPAAKPEVRGIII